MPHLITMKDKKNYPIFGDSDMSYLARIYAGDEFANEMEAILSEADADCAVAKAEVEELRKVQEMELEYVDNLLRDIVEEADALTRLLSRDRLNRKQLQEGINRVWKLANKLS